MAPTRFQPLNDDERTWLTTQLRVASSLVPGLSGPDALPTLPALDRLWRDFVRTGDAALEGANAMVLCVGIAMGEHLVRFHGFAWCLVTDDWGTDICVRALPERGDVSVVPTDFVSKRWDQRETEFIEDAVWEIAQTVAKLEKDWNNRPSDD